MSIELSIVIPVYNEEANLKNLFSRLSSSLQNLLVEYEVIVVDDGSKDRSVQVLQEIQATHKYLRIVKLRRNYGQHPATFAGFEVARGQYVVTLDADMQNDPADIAKLLQKIKEGYDVVSGKRVNRQDPFLRRRLPSKMVNWFISKQTGLTQTDTGCFLKAYTAKAAREIAAHTESGGFFTATIGLLGMRYTEVPVNHAERQGGGKSRYNLFTQLNMVMSLFTGYARKPFQIIEILGGAILFLGLFLFVCFSVQLQISNTLLSLIVAILGLILGSLGVLGEFAVRIYYTSRNRPIYIIEKVLES